MKRIAELIQANLNLRVFLPLLVLALATTWYGLFYSVDKFAEMTGGLTFMDMQRRLIPEEMFAQAASFSPETVSFYIGWSIFDYAWPLVSFTTSLFICAWLLTFLAEKWQQRFWWLVAAAYTTVLFDWLENIGFVAVVLSVPDEPLWIAQTASVMHDCKMLFMMTFNLGWWILLPTVIVIEIRRRFSR
ncbi:MAG: hypothetical protein CL799_09900 [Chromatiales bacterium]|nr:hypothetical protein [Chromatiales bacterium]MDP6150937.1 hypothetical protein [Gammaproteobacteria bacterium]MDP7270909.1 hypothetical protein [Gammaproteobacteria bacterium]HJP05579.1 hypothetical protein [Gammaproteobacteria bacterium]